MLLYDDSQAASAVKKPHGTAVTSPGEDTSLCWQEDSRDKGLSEWKRCEGEDPHRGSLRTLPGDFDLHL